MGFEVIPSIDLRAGKCVRLAQGDFARETIFGDDPAAAAGAWAAAGARVIHVVDLDGAREGRPANLDALRAIRAATTATLQFGGGLRTDAAVDDAVRSGADRVVLGTALITRPRWVEDLCRRLDDRVVVGIDARNGHVATEGWTSTSTVETGELVERANTLGVRWGLHTDIERDGILQGPNLVSLSRVVDQASFAVLASGGVATLEDLVAIRETRAAGAIVGRALYTGQLNLADAIQALASRDDGC
jgi:phosphoribosylformimino-5-aminoimidazole carboxamide ribotide isomerase